MHKLLMMMPMLLAGCTAATTEAADATPAPPQGVCAPAGLDRFIGQTATADLAGEMMKASGAATLRWIAPGMAVTMDFRQDRLTVSYDENYRILRVSCG